jgi:hypothetical protein
MMRLRRASLLVSLSLLSSAATAYAECAWVLWEQTTTWKASPKNVEETQWAPVTAAASAQPICESPKANRIRETARRISSVGRPKDTILPIDDSVMWSWEEPDGTGRVPVLVEKEKWRILPVGEVHDQPAALAGGHRRNAPWGRVSGKLRQRIGLSPPR